MSTNTKAVVDELMTDSETIAIVLATRGIAAREVARLKAGTPPRVDDAWDCVMRFVRATLIAEGAAPSTWEADADPAALDAVRSIFTATKKGAS